MTEEPVNQTLVLLREIRAKQDEHSGRLDSIDRRLQTLEREMTSASTRIRLALGTAHGAEYVANESQSTADSAMKKIDELIARLEAGELLPDV